ncbi:hypothetical protein BS50DRAFT_531477 [Corynespora cassiicola Philippines]|uniref:Orc1-like AAA ATPase domain-containing protein n=1 Tax=Corynespora cassiicola Philippines TaxID=1448308 RepID=A0A2T2NEQ7_CORCC|nr:hypothetical protein BS50DRAFT_531477 [Corynespora cassiicola Philippines]
MAKFFRHLLGPAARYPQKSRTTPLGPHLSKKSTASRLTKSTSNTNPGRKWRWKGAASKLLEGSATALSSIIVLSGAGYSYHKYYNAEILRKMEDAFASGYSTLELASLGRQVAFAHALSGPGTPAEHVEEDDDWIPRSEQDIVDDIVNGKTQGQYHLITGEKGTGKTSMLLKAMTRIDGEGVAMMEAHGDLEIFRVRLGKALNYQFHEDYIGSLFSVKGPRESTPLLDIERAFDRMEKIALRRQEQKGRPLVLIINGAHLLHDNEEGQHLLELIQQRAELWAASRLVTVVLNSNDWWITERLNWQASRLSITPVRDVPKDVAVTALRNFRAKLFGEDVSDETLNHIYSKIGGRLRFLIQVAKSQDMKMTCNSIIEKELRWFLSQCWVLGKDMNIKAQEQQEFCIAAMVLAKKLVVKEQEMSEDEQHDGKLPQIPLHESRQIVTRADFIRHHDQINIIAIDSDQMVQADSVAMQNVFRQICEMNGFEEHLQATTKRMQELESLSRTRELTLKDSGRYSMYHVDTSLNVPRLARDISSSTISLETNAVVPQDATQVSNKRTKITPNNNLSAIMQRVKNSAYSTLFT